jgi:hypothetical protein
MKLALGDTRRELVVAALLAAAVLLPGFGENLPCTADPDRVTRSQGPVNCARVCTSVADKARP